MRRVVGPSVLFVADGQSIYCEIRKHILNWGSVCPLARPDPVIMAFLLGRVNPLGSYFTTKPGPFENSINALALNCICFVSQWVLFSPFCVAPSYCL